MDKPYAAPTMTELIHRRAWELMSDGQWYPLETIVAELMKVIPPGVALRHAEKRWLIQMNTPSKIRQRGGVATQRTERQSDTELIRIGRRQLVMSAIQQRPSRSVPSAYEMDPPTQNKLGRNKHTRSLNRDRRIRVTRANRIIAGDLRRAEWIRPVLNHLIEVLRADRNAAAIERVRQIGHEQGMHVMACPSDCTF